MFSVCFSWWRHHCLSPLPLQVGDVSPAKMALCGIFLFYGFPFIFLMKSAIFPAIRKKINLQLGSSHPPSQECEPWICAYTNYKPLTAYEIIAVQLCTWPCNYKYFSWFSMLLGTYACLLLCKVWFKAIKSLCIEAKKINSGTCMPLSQVMK